MPVEYVNRREDIYYLHQGKTKTGKPKYYFSLKKDGNLVESIPKGYNIYENPNAQVFLKRITRKVITNKEISTVEKGIRKFSELKYFEIDVKKNSIVVFIPDQDVVSLRDTLMNIGPIDELQLSQSLRRCLTYSPMMRFRLVDKESREFRVDRFCFMSGIDEWIPLDSSTDLAKLVEEYCKHLGKESFYDLT